MAYIGAPSGESRGAEHRFALPATAHPFAATRSTRAHRSAYRDAFGFSDELDLVARDHSAHPQSPSELP